MNDYAVVLNAGSSSLKFCIYRRPERNGWGLDARGQIEGIGSSPRFSVKSGAGEMLDNRPLGGTVVDAPSALESLAGGMRSRSGGARVGGVGHRVGHGGSTVFGPTLVRSLVLVGLR